MLLDKVFNHELYIKKHIKTDEGVVIPAEALTKIAIYVRREYHYKYNNYKPWGPFYPSTEVSDVWLQQKGEYRGTFPKRYAKWIKDKFELELDEQMKSIIGAIARDSLTKSLEVVYDMVDKIDWEDGDFGDKGSCFWRENQRAKDVIREHPTHFRIIRIFEPDPGRMLLTRTSDNKVVAFNPYGLSDSDFRAILSKVFDAVTAKVPLSNLKEYSHPLYINNLQGFLLHNGDGDLDKGYVIPIDLEPYRSTPCAKCKTLVTAAQYCFSEDRRIYCYQCVYS